MYRTGLKISDLGLCVLYLSSCYCSIELKRDNSKVHVQLISERFQKYPKTRTVVNVIILYKDY